MLYIITLGEMKAVLGITDGDDDVSLELWLEGIQGRFDEKCRRTLLYSEGLTETFDGGGTYLLTDSFPVNTIDSIVVASDQDWDNGDALAVGDYRLNNRRGRLTYGSIPGWQWPEGIENIRVSYSGGLIKSDGTPAPNARASQIATLRRCFLLQGNFEWRLRKTMGLSQISQGGVSVQQGPQVTLALKGATLIPEVETGLQRFIRTA